MRKMKDLLFVLFFIQITFWCSFGDEGTAVSENSGMSKRMMITTKHAYIRLPTTYVIYHGSERTYSEAVKECEKEGGRLASLPTKTKLQNVRNAMAPLNSGYYWIGSRRPSSWGEFTWVAGEYLEPIAPNSGYWSGFMTSTDQSSNQLKLYYTGNVYFDNSVDGENEERHLICELDHHREDFKFTGIIDLPYATSFIIVAESNVNYTTAKAACEGYFSGTDESGGKLAEPTTFREINAIDTKIAEKFSGSSRWWVGAKRDNFGAVPEYTSGERIPANLREWDTDRGGLCMIYNSQKKKFGWEFCNVGEANKQIDGYICQDMD